MMEDEQEFVDRDNDPIQALRLEALLKEMDRYDILLRDALRESGDKEQGVPLLMMAIANRLSGRATKFELEQPTMGEVMRTIRQWVLSGPEYAAAIQMCLAVEVSVIMDQAAVYMQIGMDKQP